MVDINKKKGSGSSSSSSSSSSSKSGGSSSSSSSSSDTEPFEMGDDAIPNAEEAQISDTSERWAGDHSDLNYDAGAGGSQDKYIQRQIKECEEFYENFYQRATDHLQDINQFTLYFHAMTLAMARNRLGIKRILEERFGKTEEEAVKMAGRICEEAGESDALDRLLRDMTYRLDEDE